jgi:Telomere resolvase
MVYAVFIIADIYCKSMATVPSFLAAFVAEKQDAEAVLVFLREKCPKSISCYLSEVKRELMLLEVLHPTYTEQYAQALSRVNALIAKAKGIERNKLLIAEEKLKAFNDMSVICKNAVQRKLCTSSYSGVDFVDDEIRAITVLPEYVSSLKLTGKERAVMKKQATKALESKSSESITVQGSPLIDRCRTTLTNPRANAYDLAAALALLTGRRMVELFLTGAFEPVEDNEQACVFAGQVKKGALEVDIPYQIPLLASINSINDALQRLRAAKACEGLDNRAVNAKYTNSCNSAARRLLGKQHHFHTLRGVYAILAHTCTLPHKLSINSFLSKVLGHQSLNTSLHYSNIHVENLRAKHKFVWTM